MTHEEAFAKAFITSEKRARFGQFLANAKRRQEMLERLDHDLPYLPAYAQEVPGEQDYPDELEKLLCARGAGATCHVIGAGLKADGRMLPVGEALRLICMNGGGALLSFLPGRLAYYRPAAPGRGLILERLPAPRNP